MCSLSLLNSEKLTLSLIRSQNKLLRLVINKEHKHPTKGIGRYQNAIKHHDDVTKGCNALSARIL